MTPKELEASLMPELDKIYRVAHRMTLCSCDAEDLVGEALCSAFKNCDRIENTHPVAWFIKTMRNHRLHQLRSEARMRSTPGVDLRLVADPRSEKVHENSESKMDIQTALDRLPEEYRLAVALVDMEEFDYNEAAIIMDVPVGTVRSRLSRGRKMLQNSLSTWSLRS